MTCSRAVNLHRHVLSWMAASFYDPYAAAAIKYANYTVTGVQLVVDGGWAHSDGEQTALFDNTNIDGDIVTTTTRRAHPASEGRLQERRLDGPRRTTTANAFKNQGDCVSYANQNGK